MSWSLFLIGLVGLLAGAVGAHDFPETEARLFEMAQKAGFSRMERVVQFGPHHLWAFERTN